MYRYPYTGRAYVKRHESEGYVILAVCDEMLLGRSINNNGIDFTVSRAFYGGVLLSVREAVNMLNDADVVNLVGNEVVEEAIRRGFVVPEAVADIDGVKHAQIIRIMY